MPCKYLRLASILREEVLNHQFDFQYKLPTELELCKIHNVSRQTVRQALLLLEEEKIIQRRQGSGTYPVASPSHSLLKQAAIILSDSYSYQNPTILKESQSLFNDHGYSVQIFTTESLYEQERCILKSLLSRPISYALVMGLHTAMPNPNIIFYNLLLEKGTKFIFLDSVYPELTTVPCVSIDYYKAACALTDYLITQLHHTKIAGIFCDKDLRSHRQFSGFCNTILKNNLSLPDVALYWEQPEKSSFSEEFMQYVRKNCTAILCYNDEAAYRFIKAFTRIGGKIPQDLSVVSFDNSYLSSLSMPTLTSVSPTKSPWIQAVSCLLGLSGQYELPFRMIHKNSDRKL